jgi:hypothetical protein
LRVFQADVKAIHSQLITPEDVERTIANVNFSGSVALEGFWQRRKADFTLRLKNTERRDLYTLNQEIKQSVEGDRQTV